jgi:SAM-dependent methyltransferase
MHTSSYLHMADLAARYLTPGQPLRILDIGSYNVNGSYKDIFAKPQWQYSGVDLTPGPNVEIVLQSPYRLPFSTNSVDLVISGQAFEHVEYFWHSWLEMVRVVRPGGYLFLIAPSRGPEHRFPVDCWRFYPDGYHALAKYANVALDEVQIDWTPHSAPDSEIWGDCVGVFRKVPLGFRAGLKQKLRTYLQHWLLPA